MSQENSTVFVEIATFGALNFLTFARRMNGQDVPLDLIFAMRHVRIAHLAMKEGLWHMILDADMLQGQFQFAWN